jgi:6-phosphogluconate dehydrogenase
MHALELGVPVTLIAEAVFSRSISAMKEVRILASTLLKGPSAKYTGDKKQFVNDLEKALYASKIVSYAQGFMLMRAAAERYHWSLNFGSIAQLWRAGCIIRSGFLGNVKDAFQNNPALTNLLLDPYFTYALETAQKAWRSVIARAIEAGIPIPALSSALSFYDGYRCAKLPANLLQAQRDYFGVHTYERIDKPRGKFFHTDWK